MVEDTVDERIVKALRKKVNIATQIMGEELKSMDLKEYILPVSSMIGGWYIPPVICDDLISLFTENKDKHAAGVVGPPLRVDPSEKVSTEVPIHPTYDHPTFIIYKNLLANIIHLYEKKYPEVEEFSKFGMVESCQIQHYKPGEGFKKWHFERISGKENRCLVFMTYLNDVPDAGTHFKYQYLTTPAEKGINVDVAHRFLSYT